MRAIFCMALIILLTDNSFAQPSCEGALSAKPLDAKPSNVPGWAKCYADNFQLFVSYGKDKSFCLLEATFVLTNLKNCTSENLHVSHRNPDVWCPIKLTYRRGNKEWEVNAWGMRKARAVEYDQWAGNRFRYRTLLKCDGDPT